MRSLIALLLAAPAAAQAPAWTVHGDAAGDSFGFALCAAGDWDGDGVVDLLVGSPGVDVFGPESGRLTLLSGATSATLFEVHGLNTGDRAGRAVAALGDVNNDGIGDFAYGAPTRSVSGPQTGGVFVVSGADGSVLLSWEGTTPYGVFGFSVASAGDLDGDGREDLLVGAPNEDPAGPDSGAAYVFSTQTSGLIHYLPGTNPGDRFGSMVLSVGDANLDTVDDFLVGSPDETSGGALAAGSARLFSGVDASNLGAWFGGNPDARFGSAACSLGDRNADGRADFVIGAPGDTTGGPASGRVELRSGADGGLFLAVNGPMGSGFGASLAALGDVDSDGTNDLLVGAPTAGLGGEVLLLSGLAGSTLTTVQTGQPGAQLGHAVTSLSVVGAPEWASAAPLGDLGPSVDHGTVTLYSDSIQLGEIFCAGDGTAAPCPCGNLGPSDHGCANGDGTGAHLRGSGSSSVQSADLVFTATSLPQDQPALLYTGVNRIQSGQGVAFGDGLRCTGGAVVRLGVQFTDTLGGASWGPLFSNAPWTAGTTRHFQAWYRNNPVSACGSGFNFSNGYTIAFTP